MDIVDPVREMELLREIKDIMDELQTMNEIFADQRVVLSDFLKLVVDPALTGISQNELTALVRSRQGDIDLMIGQARATSRAVSVAYFTDTFVARAPKDMTRVVILE